MITPAPLPLRHPACLLATWGGAGLLRPAPGTWGSLAALPFAWAIAYVGGWPVLAAAAVIVFLIGCWSAQVFETAAGGKDPGSVVIDEVAGQWLTLLPAATDPLLFAVGFVLFRIADIVKPWPANVADRRIAGGFGIMADDVVAAAYAGAVLLALRLWLYGG